MNPYTILGVKKNATAKTIQKAYRRLAMKHHPDRGGDKDTFQLVQTAYEILSDPARRSRYDATGDTSATTLNDPVYMAALTVLASALSQAIIGCAQRGDKIESTDIAAGMRQQIGEQKNALQKAITGGENAKKLLAAAVGRFETKEGDENILEEMVKAHLEMATRELENANRNLEINARAISILKAFTFKHKKPDPYGVQSATASSLFTFRFGM